MLLVKISIHPPLVYYFEVSIGVFSLVGWGFFVCLFVCSFLSGVQVVVRDDAKDGDMIEELGAKIL